MPPDPELVPSTAQSQITAPHGSLATLGKAQDFRLAAQGASATVFPPMSEAEKLFSLPRPASMNPPGARSNLSVRRWPLVLTAAAVAAFMIAASHATDLPPAAGPVPAERLVIQYRLGSYQLLSRTPLIKVLPPSDDLPATNRAVSGFWFEVQTPGEEVKYRRIMPDPIKVYTEVPGPAPEPRPERAEAVPAEVLFTLLIPQVPGSNNLVLVSSSPSATGNAQAAQAIVSIPLAERPKSGK